MSAIPLRPASTLRRAWAWLRDTVIGAFDIVTFLNGSRIILLAAVPFVLGLVLHSPQTGLFTALGAIFIGFSDLPGSYRRRATGLLCVTVLLAASAAIGTMLPFVRPWDLAALLVLGSLLAFVGTLTANAGKATTFALVLLILAGGIPGDWSDTGVRAAAILAGGAWMIFGTLIAWPLAPFTPARKAVQAGLSATAEVIETALAGLSVPRPDASAQANAGWRTRMAAYQSLDAAMEVLTDLRAAREGTSMTGRRLVLAMQQARLIAVSVTALGEVMDRIPEAARPAVDPVVAGILRDMAREVAVLGTAIGPNAQALPPPSPTLDAAGVRTRLASLQANLRSDMPEALPDLEDVEFSLLNLSAEVARAREALAGTIEGPPGTTADLAPIPPLQALLGAHPAHVLVDNLALRSPRLRHALRVGVVLALTTFAQDFLAIPHGYWVSLMAITILKPGYGGTRAAGTARVAGTIIGGIAAAVLLHFFHGTLAHAVFAAAFAVCAFGVIFRNLAIGTVLLTPFVVMLFALLSPIGDDLIWLTRIGDTIIGALIAFMAMLTLWPSSERERVPFVAGAAIGELNPLLRLLVQRNLGAAIPREEIRRQRRAMSLAMTELDACWERLLGEPRRWHPDRDSYYTLVSLVRLAAVQAAPLSASPPRPLPAAAEAAATAMLEAMLELQAALAACLEGRGAPPDVAAYTRRLRALGRELDRHDPPPGPATASGGGKAPAGVHMLAGTLERLAHTLLNMAQLAARLAAGGSAELDPEPRYAAPTATVLVDPSPNPVSSDRSGMGATAVRGNVPDRNIDER